MMDRRLRDIHPFEYDDKHKPQEEHPLFEVSGMIEKQECDHIGNYKIAPSAYVIVRFCACCGKSWRMPAKGDYTGDDAGSFPPAEWEEIAEPVEQRILPDYEG